MTVALLAFASAISSAAPGFPAGLAFDIDARVGAVQLAPLVGRAANGTTVVIWEQAGGPGPQALRGRRFAEDGSPLDDGFLVALTGGSSGERPLVSDLAVAADGSFAVVWSQRSRFNPTRTAFTTQVQMRRFAADGAPLGEVTQVARDADGFNSVPSVAIDSDGDTVVGWSSSQVRVDRGRGIGLLVGIGLYYAFVDERRIVAQRYDRAGQPVGSRIDASRRPELDVGTGVVGPLFAVESYFTAMQQVEGVEVAMDDDGDFVLAWRESLATQRYLRVSLPQPNGTVLERERLGSTLKLRRYARSGLPLDVAPVLVRPTAISGLDGQVSVPAAALANNGNATVAWCESLGSGTRLRVRQVAPLAGLALDRADIPVALDCSAKRLAIAGVGDGRYALAWTDVAFAAAPLPDAGEVRSRVYAADGQPLGPLVEASTVPGQWLLDPAVALGLDGALSLAWTTADPRTARLRQYAAP